MKVGVFFFVVVALCAACLGAGAGLIVADFVAAVSLVWAWIIYESEDNNNE